MRTTILSVLIAIASVSVSSAQTPAPIVVQAVNPTATTKSAATAGVTTASTETTLKALQAIKAANEEILKAQAATLEKLDEMEKAANELRIYSKRG